MNDKQKPQIPDDLFEELARSARKHGRRERQRLKDQWIAKARALFVPSERQPCHICGKHRTITHAHHVVALADQYDRGLAEPDHEHVWLCPNHHTIIHRFLSGGDEAEGERVSRGLLEGFTRQEIATLHALLLKSNKGLPQP